MEGVLMYHTIEGEIDEETLYDWNNGKQV